MNPNTYVTRTISENKLTRASFLTAENIMSRDCKLDRANRSHRRNRGGAAAVEFAVIAPVFFLFVFGMIEFGRGIMVQQILTNASREGARFAVLDNSTEPEVKAKVADYCQGSTITALTEEDVQVWAESDEDPPVQKALAEANFGDPITVQVSIEFDKVSWLPTPMWLGSAPPLSAKTVMRRESVR